MEQNAPFAIETKRLLLRPLEDSDWEMISYLRSDETVNKFVQRPAAKSKTQAFEFIEKIKKGVKNEQLFYWVITKKRVPTMIGSICLWNFSNDKKIAEIGYDLAPNFQGQAIMDEALKGIIEFAFKQLNLDKIEAFTYKENAASIKLLERNNSKLVDGKKDKANTYNIIYQLRN